MKKILNILLIAFLLCILIYVCFIDNLPENIIIFSDEELNLPKIFGISFEDNNTESSILTSSNLNKENASDKKMKVKFFNVATVKDLNISIIKRKRVIANGQITGIKLYTDGVLIVGMSEVEDLNGKKYKPYEGLNLQEGDRITKINDEDIVDTEDLLEKIDNSKGKELRLAYLRNNEFFETNITPVLTKKDGYKIGIWVRDSAAGIGTMTYYEPETGKFAALGHGITDIDTGELLNISNGELLKTKIVSIVKGLKGTPGKIQGTIDEEPVIGTIYKNTDLGIYGKITEPSLINTNSENELEVAKKEEINLGEASILCYLDSEGIAKEYKIEIEKIFLNNDSDNKSMLIKVVDNELLSKTGGIIQGMSGSPVIQNGKFIGAITNVLVNDPSRGYAVFGEIMLKETSEF